MAPLSLRTTISGIAAASIAVVAVITLSITISTSLAALRGIGRDHAAALLDGAGEKTLTLFDGPLTITEVLKNYTRKYQWNWPSDDPSVYRDFENMHESAFFASKLQSATVLTYCADNTRWFYGPFIPDPTIYVKQHNIASSITAANWNFTAQTIANDVNFWFMDNHSVVPQSNFAWSVPLALTKVRQSGFWDGTLLIATGGGAVSVIAPIALVNFAGISSLYVPILAPLYRRDDTLRNASQLFGVTIAAMYIDGISEFLRDIRGTPNTAAFAIEGSGYLIGSSLNAQHPFQIESQRNESDPVPNGCASTGGSSGISTNAGVIWVCRTHARDYPHKPLQAMSKLEYQGVNFMRVAGRAVVHEQIDGSYYYLATLYPQLRAVGLRVQLLLAMPEEDVIGDVVSGRNIAIGITAAVFVVVAGALFGLVTLLLAPLHDVSERMMLAAALEDTDNKTALSSMQEVADLQASYDAMNAELCRIRSFVPQSVLASRMTADDMDLAADTTADETAGTDNTTVRSNAHSRRSSAIRSAAVGSSARRSGKSSSHHGGALLDITPLKNHAVTVMVCNLYGFHRATGNASREAASRSIGDFVDLVVTEVGDHSGVLASFNGDTFVASFNAVRPCPSHARRACTAALAITRRAPLVGLRLEARAGVSTGKCLLGNAGTPAVKSFNVVGAAVTQAFALERLAKLYKAAVMVPDRTCTDIQTHMSYECLDVVHLPGRAQPTVISRIVGVRSENEAAAVGGQQPADGEWLYVVQSNEANDPHAAINECFRLVAHGDTEAAAAIFANHAATPATNDGAGSPTALPADVAEPAKDAASSGAARMAQLIAGGVPASRDLGLFYAAAFGATPPTVAA